jgi:hypothetical protein
MVDENKETNKTATARSTEGRHKTLDVKSPVALASLAK